MQAAEERDPAVASGHRDGLLLGDVGGRGRDDHVGAASAGEPHDLRHDVHLRGVDDVVGLDGVRAHGEALVVDVDQDDGPDLVDAPGNPDVHAADGSGAEDDREVTLLDAELLLGVDGARERLGGGRLVVPHVLGDAVEAVDLEHLLRTIMYSANPPSYW